MLGLYIAILVHILGLCIDTGKRKMETAITGYIGGPLQWLSKLILLGGLGGLSK